MKKKSETPKMPSSNLKSIKRPLNNSLGETSSPPKKRKGRPPIKLRSPSNEDKVSTKKRTSSPSKSPGRKSSPDKRHRSPKVSKDKAKTSSKDQNKGKGKSPIRRNGSKVSPCNKGPQEKGSKSKSATGSKVKSKSASSKKSTETAQDSDQFIDLWSLATIGKREASLNATMKVNILYERQISPKKSACSGSVNADSKELHKSTSDLKMVSKTPCEPPEGKNNKMVGSKEKKQKTGVKKFPNKKNKEKVMDNSNKKGEKRKRKVSPYTIYEDEPVPKSKKTDNKQTKKSKKQPKKRYKSFVLRHHLGNIIERSPRQASLNAKAMIAMEQEEDVVLECAARTRVYDWTEVRPFLQNDSRKLLWVTGHGDPKRTSPSKETLRENEKKSCDNEPPTMESYGEKGFGDINGNLSMNSIQNTMLKTIHEIGDPRLWKEYLRSQKEDVQGSIDIETCPSPKQLPINVEEKPATSSPTKKKIQTAASTNTLKTPEKQQTVKVSEKAGASPPSPSVKDRPVINSPAKPKPCRVATPIPQFSAEKRATQMTSFVHHPVPQTFYQHPQQPPQPKPIKVTPYSPSNPAYVYQYPAAAPDRQQQGVYVQNNHNPSTMPYRVENNELSQQRDFQSPSFSFNHMGGLSLGRRGLNPYQGSAYTSPIHLPVQAFGFNFHTGQYYQQPLQHLQAQQNMPSLQPCSIQQYPLVQQSMIQPHPMVQNLNQLQQSYPTGFSPYANMNAPHVNQDSSSCMPPPSPRQSNPSPQKEPCSQNPPPSLNKQMMAPPPSTSPTKYARSQKQVGLTSSPLKQAPNANLAYLSQCTGEVALPKTPKEPTRLVLNYNTPACHIKSSFSLPTKHSTSIKVLPICKTEQPTDLSTTVKKSAGQSTSDTQNKGISSFKVIGENSSVSDVLHSVHSTMFPTETPVNSDPIPQVSLASPSKSCQTSKIVEGERNIRFSVSSILDMPTIKVKTEPYRSSCSKSAIKILQGDQNGARGTAHPGTFLICIPQPQASKPNAKSLLVSTTNPGIVKPIAMKPPKVTAKEAEFKELLNNRDKVIVIDDSDSSDDEPLAKLVQTKTEQRPLNAPIAISSCQNKAVEAKLPEPPKVQSKSKPVVTKDVEPKKVKAKSSNNEKEVQVFTQLKLKPFKEQVVKPPKSSEAKSLKNVKLALKKAHKKTDLEKVPTISKVPKSDVKGAPKKPKANKDPKLVKKVPVRRKSKSDVTNMPVNPAVHGWSWVGVGEWGPIPKLTQQKEEVLRNRMCYRTMKHISGETISVRDSVILQSDGDGSAPYVAKVSALWESLNGDMMFSMLWYYQPEHTSVGRESEDGEQELFASKHREENSVACIDDKCYVLMYNEFCRMESEAVRQAQGCPLPRWRELLPSVSDVDKSLCRALPSPNVCLDNIWFSRYDYDIRKKLVRKPKHKKNDLRYRAPCKLVS